MKEGSDDESFVRILCENVCGENSGIKRILRIGQREQEKNRPVKVIFKDEAEKKRIMSNLSALKGKTEYMNLRITHDYSILERKLIREWVKQAKEKSEKSETLTFKVWGNIKEGLYCKRFWKKKKNIKNRQEENKNTQCKSTS